MKKNANEKYLVVSQFLSDLGFDEESIRIYFELCKAGPITISELSKNAKIERTKIYRRIEELTERNLIEEIQEFNRKLIRAGDISKIERIMHDKAITIENLTRSLPSFSQTVNSLASGVPSSKVLYYRGKEGIKQMLWNELSAKGESLCFIYKLFDTFVGSSFFDHWAEEFSIRNMKSREIRTDIFLESYEEQPNEICYHMKNVQIRYLPSKVFPMTHAMSIYNNVVAIYNWWHDEIFGVEMYNTQVADMQRIFFEEFWKKAEPYRHQKHDGTIKIL